MKQKLLPLFVLLLLVSCKNDSPIIISNPPELVSSTPQDGTTKFAVQDFIFQLVFDVNVTCPKAGQSKIVLEGASIGNIEANLKIVTIAVSGLSKNKTYTLIIPKDVILSPAKVGNDEIKITFTTIDGELSTTLCTSNPSLQAQKVYSFLKENFGVKLISGTMANVSWNTNEAEWVYKHTGKYPALNCFDYIHLYASPANWIDYSNTSVVENWWNNNGLVAAMWHWNVPTYQGSANYNFYADKTTFDASKATVEGTYENNIVKADLEKIANNLLLLKNKNIPVIWRPLHEASGNVGIGGTAWFWWGTKGSENFKKLWVMMFDTFKAKGLNNLIWVWTTQINDASWYPGDNYVDIIGCDEYNKTDLNAVKTDYNSLVQTYPNKIIALSEFGNMVNMTSQWDAGVRWSWIMPWYDYDRTVSTTSSAFDLTSHQYADINYWNAVLANQNVITRDKMPNLK